MPPKDGEKLQKRKNKFKTVFDLASKNAELDSDMATNSLNVLNGEIERYKHKQLRSQEVDDLMKSYKIALAHIAMFTDNNSKKMSPEFKESLEKVTRALSKDLRVLRNYAAGLEKDSPETPARILTFNELLETSRSRRIEVNSENVESVGAGQHVRAVIPAGNDKLYFTESVKINSQDEEQRKLFDSYRQEFGEEADFLDHKQMKEVLEFIYLSDAYRKIKNRPCFSDSKTIITAYQEQMRKEIADMKKAGKKPAFNENTPDVLSGLNTVRKRKIFLKYLSDFTKMRLAAAINRVDGIHNGCYQDKRNSAMSFIAEELGVGDLIAHSENVHITFNDKGKKRTVKGTAMNAAHGEDLNKVGVNSNYIKISLASLENPGLIKKVASLQILDYICGNSDRHLGNLTYITDDNGNVIGIQGFDNDSSFGSRFNPTGSAGKKVPVKDFGIIPESLAESIMKMDNESVKLMLHGFDLDSKEIKAAINRLDELKKTITQSRKVYAEKELREGELIKDIPRVVKDEELGKYSFVRDLARFEKKGNKAYGNLFGSMMSLFANGNAVNEVYTTQKAIINNSAEAIVRDFWSDASDIVKNMKVQNPKKALGSKQYDAMLGEAEQLETMLKNLEAPLFAEARNRDTGEKSLIFDPEVVALKAKATRVKELTQKYLNERAIPRKAAQKSKNSRAYKRFALAMRVKDMSESLLKKYDNIDKAYAQLKELDAKGAGLKKAAKNRDRRFYEKLSLDKAVQSIINEAPVEEGMLRTTIPDMYPTAVEEEKRRTSPPVHIGEKKRKTSVTAPKKGEPGGGIIR
ncbi:MAG: hypothetical protein IKQ56_08360 [Lachnospiraceae bacterium]|nr:hypothetical protein [Lachnospiraceae bacterium]